MGQGRPWAYGSGISRTPFGLTRNYWPIRRTFRQVRDLETEGMGLGLKEHGGVGYSAYGMLDSASAN